MKSRLSSLLIGVTGALALTLGTPGCAHRTAQAPPEPPAAPPVSTAVPEPAPPVVETPAPAPPPTVAPDFDPAYFGFDSDALGSSAREALDHAAKLMREQADLRVRIEGHCDERGTAEYNMALGERRASAAREYLLASGVAGDRIQVVSYGEERPIVDGHDETAWSRNRCAQIVVQLTTAGAALTTGDSK